MSMWYTHIWTYDHCWCWLQAKAWGVAKGSERGGSFLDAVASEKVSVRVIVISYSDARVP